ncbi:hypothetical protein RN001_013783 [Aquatica leii]|uniref:Uncharacterized protein n=1 Tax=Aquatica leii TaxID=1421715 RepID=A0AAN7SLR3_9COLE|nr:hypothetical protein RN001_013783 [Aquatica leii]
MKFLIVVVACLAVANAYTYGHHGALVGASGVVSAYGASGPSGVVTPHGAIGPHGDHSAIGHIGHVGHVYAHGYDDGQYHGEGLLESQDWAGHHGVVAHSAVVAPALAHSIVGHHGLGHAAVVAAPALAHGYHDCCCRLLSCC